MIREVCLEREGLKLVEGRAIMDEGNNIPFFRLVVYCQRGII